MVWSHARLHLAGISGSLALLLALGCGNEPAGTTGDGTGTSTGMPSTSMASATSTSSGTTLPPPPPPVTTAADTTTFGPGCGRDPCPEKCGPECEPTGTCIASVWMCECDCPMTDTGEPTCPTVDEAVEEWTDPSQTPAIDCGTVTPDDDAMAWQTVHDCVVLSAAGTAFRAQWLQPMDSDPIEFAAALRVVPPSEPPIELGWFERSEPDSLTRHLCTAIEATPDCVVEPGQMCLTCVDQAEDETLCPLR